MRTLINCGHYYRPVPLTGLAVYSLLHRNRGKKIITVDNPSKDGLSDSPAPDVHRVELKLANGRTVYLDSRHKWSYCVAIQVSYT